MNELQDWQNESLRQKTARPFIIFPSDPPWSMSSIGVVAGSLAVVASETVLPDQQIAKIIVDAIAKVPKVQSICAEFRKNEVAIWTLLSDYDREARKAVYEHELAISRQFGLRDFDFRVTSVDLVSPEDLKKTNLIEIFKRK